MFEYEDLSRLDASGALDALERAQQVKRQAEVAEALAMLRMVQTYRHQIGTDKVRLAGAGTGMIDDFACLELAAALRRPVDSVTAEVIELLDLEVRLPRLWEQVIACGVPVWQARRLARATHELSLSRALWVDATIAPFATRLGFSRLARFVEALVVQADPATAEARWAKRTGRKVSFGPTTDSGLREVYGWLNAADAVYLDAALAQLSEILAGQGSAEDADERRATALGILATPARALALIQHSLNQPRLDEPSAPIPADPARNQPTKPIPAEPARNQPTKPIPAEPARNQPTRPVPAEPARNQPTEPVPEEPARNEPASRRAADADLRSPAGCSGHTCGTISVPPDRLLPKATLVVHISDQTITTGIGVGRCEQLGPLTIGQIKQLLAGSRVTVRPVFDPNGIVPVDSYEIPEPTRRAVLQRHPSEVFPYSSWPSVGLDLDHTDPYRPGRQGQTRPANLGPLRRKTHRAKTHAGWQLKQPEPGMFVWITPLGRRYIVTPAGITNSYTRVPGNQPWDSPLGGPLLPELSRSSRRARPRRGRAATTRPVLRR